MTEEMQVYLGMSRTHYKRVGRGGGPGEGPEPSIAALVLWRREAEGWEHLRVDHSCSLLHRQFFPTLRGHSFSYSLILQ
jgi:hypothetical protein